MVYKSLSSYSTKIIPTSIIASIAPLTNVQTVLASEEKNYNIYNHFKERMFPDLFNYGEPNKFNLYTRIVGEDHEGAIKSLKFLLETITKAVEWFKNIDYNIYILTTNLLSSVYKFLTKITLTTPVHIFNNIGISQLSIKLSLISVSLVILLSTIESIKQIFGVKHTKIINILKKYPFAVFGAGIAPFAFENIFKILNKISISINQLNVENMTSSAVNSVNYSDFNLIMLIIFNIVIVKMLLPVVLKCGKRWLNLLLLSALTPLALVAWMFENLNYLFMGWVKAIKSLSFIQIVHSAYLYIIGLIIFGIRDVGNADVLFIKLLLVIGGLDVLANPPSFINKHLDESKNALDTAKNLKKVIDPRELINPLKMAGKNFKKVFS